MTMQPDTVVAWRRAASGAILAAIGIAIIAISWRYPFGTVTQMGPGFIPHYVGLGIVALGVVILITDLRSDAVKPVNPIRWRAFVLISAGISLFALLINWLGLVPAMFLSVAVSMLADDEATPLGILIYAGAMTVLGWALFIKALGLPLTAFLV
ncbi:MAG: tripartite tricarboxylate transporter TctB family protein [Celeribacter sp.]|jgi:uncharacterized membrane protein YidH (DUF202 family)